MKLNLINFPAYETIKNGAYIRYEIAKTHYFFTVRGTKIDGEESTLGVCHDSFTFENTPEGYEQVRAYIENKRNEALNQIIEGKIILKLPSSNG